MNLKIAFAGSPDFSCIHLEYLIQNNCNIVAVITKQDKKQGRGKKIMYSPVKQLAIKRNLPLFQPSSMQELKNILEEVNCDVMVVVAFGRILPEYILNLPKYGCINVHASLLPRWRGAAPIERAILSGDLRTGISIMNMVKDLDAGAVLYQQSVDIDVRETKKSLEDKLADIGKKALLSSLSNLETLKKNAKEQQNDKVTYASKLSKEESWINWNSSAHEIDRKIRAFNPSLICRFYLPNIKEEVLILEAIPINQEHNHKSGTIIKASPKGIDVACKKGILRITRLKSPGRNALDCKSWLNGKSKYFDNLPNN